MADNISKIVGVVIGSAIVALQGLNVQESKEISDELTELTRKQTETVDAIRQTQKEMVLPELHHMTSDLDELVEQGKSKR